MINYIFQIDGRMKKSTSYIISIILIGLLIGTIVCTEQTRAEIFLDKSKHYHVGNVNFNVTDGLGFYHLTRTNTYMEFNASRFYVTSANPINITLDFMNQSLITSSDSDKAMCFYASTTVGAVWFQITGFQPSKKYDIYREGVLFSTITSDVAGHLLFANTEWAIERYFEIYMSGGPPQVTVVVTDSIAPEICATIFLENEGNTAQEYIYYYFITPRVDGNLLDVDTVTSGWSSKLVNPGENFSIEQCLSGVTAGVYWYKVWAYWGAERSDAAAMFTATSPSYPGGSGAGVPQVSGNRLTVVCIDEQFNAVPDAFVSIYDGIRLLGSNIVNEKGITTFNIPRSMTVRIVATAEGYPDVEKIVVVEQSMTETIQFGEPEEAMCPWWILILIIIGGIISYYIYKKQTSDKKKKRRPA